MAGVNCSGTKLPGAVPPGGCPCLEGTISNFLQPVEFYFFSRHGYKTRSPDIQPHAAAGGGARLDACGVDGLHAAAQRRRASAVHAGDPQLQWPRLEGERAAAACQQRSAHSREVACPSRSLHLPARGTHRPATTSPRRCSEGRRWPSRRRTAVRRAAIQRAKCAAGRRRSCCSLLSPRRLSRTSSACSARSSMPAPAPRAARSCTSSTTRR